MKKMLLILLALVLIFLAGVGGYMLAKPRQEASLPEATPMPTPTPTLDPADAQIVVADDASMVVDLDALCAKYAPDSVYARVGDVEISWNQYCGWLSAYVKSVESNMALGAAYGQPFGWTSEYEGSSYAELVVKAAEDGLRYKACLASLAQANDIRVSDEELEARAWETVRGVLGEEATEEERAALLAEHFLTEELFLDELRAEMLTEKLCEALYGASGEKISDEELQRYIEEQGYLRSNHILFKTIDDSWQPLDDETIAAQKAAAEELAAELQGIEDEKELLATFAQRKADLDEDPGKVAYPDGYVFLPGQMVSVFEDTTKALKPYEVSDPVLSEYGYHVILRLPISAETPMDDGSFGAAMAEDATNAKINELVDSSEFVIDPNCARVSLTRFLIPAVTTEGAEE